MMTEIRRMEMDAVLSVRLKKVMSVHLMEINKIIVLIQTTQQQL